MAPESRGSCRKAVKRHRAWIAVAFAWVGTARADLVDCPPASSGYTVYLSQPAKASTAFASSVEAQAYLSRLQFTLDQSRDGQWIASPATDVRFVPCMNRSPALDGHEFSPSIVDLMHANRVLLEIWGEVDATAHAGGSRVYTAQLNYLLVPVQHEASQPSPPRGGMQRLVYPDSPNVRVSDPVILVGRPLDIDAFVAAALGFKLLLEQNRELAHRNLCRADVLLAGMLQRPLPTGTQKDLATLRKLLQESAGRAIAEAQADPNYDKTGVLRLQDATKPCAGEITP
jgi:hypothetical protein